MRFHEKKNLFEFQESVIFETPPLGIVPGGSGNGMAKTISYFNNETFSTLNSCYNVINGQPKDMDLTRLTTDKGKVYYSFLSVAYGFTSDVDIESECIRFLVIFFLLLFLSFQSLFFFNLASLINLLVIVFLIPFSKYPPSNSHLPIYV